MSAFHQSRRAAYVCAPVMTAVKPSTLKTSDARRWCWSDMVLFARRKRVVRECERVGVVERNGENSLVNDIYAMVPSNSESAGTERFYEYNIVTHTQVTENVMSQYDKADSASTGTTRSRNGGNRIGFQQSRPAGWGRASRVYLDSSNMFWVCTYANYSRLCSRNIGDISLEGSPRVLSFLHVRHVFIHPPRCDFFRIHLVQFRWVSSSSFR